MKREDIKTLIPDITDEQLNKLMGWNGDDVNAIRSKLTTAQNDLQAERAKLEGYDPDWKTKLEQAQAQVQTVKLDAAIESALSASGARSNKAIRAMLDMTKVTQGEDGKLAGLDDQLTALKESDGWMFGNAANPIQKNNTGGEHGSGGSAGESGIEAAFYALNPSLKPN